VSVWFDSALGLNADIVTKPAITMHVTEVTPATKWVFVEVADGIGHVGFGEATLNGREASLVDAAQRLANAALGAIDEPPAAFAARERPRDLAEAAIVSGIDQALWDRHGRSTRRGVVDALGGSRRRSIPVYANINRRTRTRTPEAFAGSARAALDGGFAAIKVAPFDGVGPAQTQASNRDGLAKGLECVAAVRDAIGRDRRLMVDCHWRFDEETARQLIHEADSLALHWIECPMPETDANIAAITRLRALANARGVRLAGLEQAIRLDAFLPWCEAGAYDVMMPDVKYAGGLAEVMRIGDELAARGIEVSPHNPSGPISHAASLHACAALPECDMLEMQFGESPLFDELCGDAVSRVTGGCAAVATGAGLGVSLDRVLLEVHAAQPARVWRRP
jgi:galactonate dehydratase